MAGCTCQCHKNPATKMCICCADAAKTLLTPPSREDKSKDILEKWLKGK